MVPNMLGIIRRLFKTYSVAEMASGLWDWWLTKILIAAAVVVVTAVLSYLQNASPLYIWMAILTSVFLTLGSVHFVNMIITRYREKSRLYFYKVLIVPQFKIEEDGSKSFVAVQLGFYLENASTLDFTYHVEHIRTSFEGRINQNPTYDNYGGGIPSRSIQEYLDALIPLSFPLQERREYTGNIEAIVSYKTPCGRSRYVKINRKITLHLNEYPNFYFKDVERLDDYADAKRIRDLMDGIRGVPR
ncbi:hypothetical protein M8R20_14915 [Pseudomonas sp. R2.Fl]|nr:hypothetical protein [Pseudomonas sp. R2.Fl]